MDNIAGPPVEGNNFFGRETEISSLWDSLQNQDVLLLGPRRIGKTSVARALMRVAANEDWHTIEVNIASCTDEQAFVEKLAKTLEIHQRSWAAQALSGIGAKVSEFLQRVKSVKLGVPGTGSLALDLGAAECEEWSALASDLLRFMSTVRDRWLIYIDELPIFLFNLIDNDRATGVQRVRRFLDWFRNDVRAMPECPRIRWLVTGSVGLDTLVQRHRMAATINSMKHESLEPFKTDVAEQMVRVLARSYGMSFSDHEASLFVQAVRWPQPYYLQLVFNFLRQLVQSTGRPAPELLAEAVQSAVQPSSDNDFHHWEERLFVQLGAADAQLCVALLTLAAGKPEGALSQALLAELQQHMPDHTAGQQREKFFELRDILQRDAYWWPEEVGDQRRYRFRLELLRLWWVRRRRL